MKAKLIIAALLWLAVPSLGLAEPPRPNYTTLVVEFVGETDRPVFPVLVSTSWQEGEWYRQHVIPKFFRVLARVDVVRAPVLNEITELPLLKRALESAKPQTSTKMLKDIARVVAKYPTLKSELQEIENRITP
jgi:hypothetical protein